MPKLLVLVGGSDDGVMTIAESIHEGARSVRFAEADMRRVAGESGASRMERLRPLVEIEELLGYDAIVLGGDASGTEVAEVLEHAGALGRAGRLANKLGSIFPAADPAATGSDHPLWPLLGSMAKHGMILVPPGYAGPGGTQEDHASAARRLGKRLIDIAAWITHARSHHHH